MNRGLLIAATLFSLPSSEAEPMNIASPNSTKPGAMLRRLSDGRIIECAPLHPLVSEVEGKVLAEMAQRSVVFNRAAELHLTPRGDRLVSISKVGEREVLIQVYDQERASALVLTIPPMRMAA